ncbi:hypothetical protein SteCoe_8448 [Stentor coeruleus]|uniref:RING-type domain-containing protein n=1 Tax=Stentor coeruleus TaxID=5963 RepID=A0A1R2CKA4_9CILI|nr:hypothetical protein SteCoe_8448 [Stentor coeruleus]
MNRNNSNSPELGFLSSRGIQDYLPGSKYLPLFKDKPTASEQYFIVQEHIQEKGFISSLSNSKSQKNLEVSQIINEYKFGEIKNPISKKYFYPIDSSIGQEKISNSKRNRFYRFNLEIDCHKFKEKSKSEVQSLEASKKFSTENQTEYSDSADKVEFDYIQSPIEPSTPEFLNELIINLKYDIEVLQKQNQLQSQHQLEMHRLFKKEIDRLTIENSELEVLLAKSYEKNESLISDMKKQSKDYEELQQKNCEIITSTEQTIKILKEKLKSKKNDFSNISLQFQLSEATKKLYFESLEKAESKTKDQKKLYEKSKSKYKVLKNIKNQLLENLETHKKKIQEQEKLNEEYKKNQHEKSLLELNIKEIKNKLIICEESLNKLSQTYANENIIWKEKESQYEQTIKNLNEQINSHNKNNTIKTSETVKVKRVLTLRGSEIVENFDKDETIKCAKNNIELEKEFTEQNLENKKFKDMDYYKSQLNKKEKIISSLGLMDNDVISKSKADYCKNTIVKICNGIKKYACCNKCMEGYNTFLTVPCNHIMCEKCKNNTTLCRVCGGEFSDIIGFKYFRLIKEAISTLERMIV